MAEPADTSAQGPGSARHDLGVLLVHGIGEQKQGETLGEFAAPILKWIGQWLEPDLRVERLAGPIARHMETKDFSGTVDVSTGVLRPPDLSFETPAHAVAKLVKRVGQVPVGQQSWLLAESWWSPQTLTPRVSQFLLWLITRGPWILLMHLQQGFGLDVGDMARQLLWPTPAQRAFLPRLRLSGAVLKFMLATGLWLLASLSVITAWCVVSLIALVPVGYVRARVYALLQALTGVIGDSFVLINDPIQRAAFKASTRRALDWLRRQGCRKVAVVAHSQGAAVARDVLFERHAPPVDGFVTFGPGIAKLDALAHRERCAPQDFLWSGAAAPLALLTAVSFMRLWSSGQTGFALWGFPLCAGALALFAIVRSWQSVAASLEALRPDALQVALRRHYQPGLRWSDFYASHDPVPNGSLSATVAAGLRRIVSRRVMVLGSLLGDHTAYWTSAADFVPRVVQALDRCAGAGLFATASGVGRLRKARANFARCVQHLVMLRWLGWLALLLPLLEFGRVQAAARLLLGLLETVDLLSLGRMATGLQAAVGSAGSLLTGRAYSGEGAAAFVLLAVCAGLALHVWSRIVAYWWGHMAALALRPVFAPSERMAARIKQGVLSVLVSALGLLPLALSVAWTFWPERIGWDTLDAFLTGFAKLTALALYLLILLAGGMFMRGYLKGLHSAYAAHGSLPKALRAAPDLGALSAYWLFYGLGGAWLLSALL